MQIGDAMKKIMNEINLYYPLTASEQDFFDFEKIDKIFNELEFIYKHKEIYDMNWAFKYSQKQINFIYNEILCPKFNNFDSQVECENFKKEMQLLMTATTKKFKYLALNFRKSKLLVTAFEIFVSFFIVIGLHFLIEEAITLYYEILSTTAIVIVFSVFKVFFEKYYVHKHLESREYSAYLQTLKSTQRSCIKLIIIYTEARRIEHDKNHDSIKKISIRAEKLLKVSHNVNKTM